jgi:hypothetical protein
MATPAIIAAALLLLATYTRYTTAFQPQSITHLSQHVVAVPSSLLSLRGGSDSEYDDDESVYDSEEEEEEPIIQKTKALASSTKSKLQKTKNASVKSAAAKAMSSSKPIKTTSGGNSVAKLYRRMVPHIIRACLNPFTFVRMSRAYFASLLDINYMKEVRVEFCRCLLILAIIILCVEGCSLCLIVCI